MTVPYEKGMIVIKRQWSQSAKTINATLWISFLILTIVAVSFYVDSQKTADCVPITETTCIRYIHSTTMNLEILMGGMIIWIVLLFICILVSYLDSTDYQLQINSQEEYDKNFPKRMTPSERDKHIIKELADIKLLLEAKKK